jgi:hypothetical protein
MRLTPPKQATFYLGAVLWLLGLIGPWIPQLRDAQVMTGLSAGYVLAVIGGLVLILGNAMDSL